MASETNSSTTQIPSTVYAYPGGTLHLAPWAAYLAGIALLWLNYAYGGGPQSFTTPRGWFWIGFALFCFFNGGYWEWSMRNQPGRIVVGVQGLTCTLPWGRQRFLGWEDIREVRCIARFAFDPSISTWEIHGSTREEWVRFNAELKGYKKLLGAVRVRAPQIERFDARPDDMDGK